MRPLRVVLPVLAALACAILIGAAPSPNLYVPAAQYCYPPSHGPALTALCPVLPGNIGPDSSLNVGLGYPGIMNVAYPTSAAGDVETPFDNLSWQTFVALNWKAGEQNKPAAEGLQGDGARVWQGWSRVSEVFGNSPVQANCQPLLGEQVFSIASNGYGTPAVRNEEYIQAATGDPAIDVKGNWTLYERRVNGVEIAYLRAPGGHAAWNLTTVKGQAAFVAAKGNVIDFPAVGAMPGAPNGAMEIKAAWRILDPKLHAANAKRFYIQRAMLAVAPDLVAKGNQPYARPICEHVELGLVAMHIIQKNPVTTNVLLPQWFWTTFEQVDNAPLADKACDISHPAKCQEAPNQQQCPATVTGNPDYSYFNAKTQDLPTNQPPSPPHGSNVFQWNPVQPYAKLFLATAKNGMKAGTQITRCWQVYKLTQQLNAQWQAKLRAAGSVFANYMLIGTQWGAKVEATNPSTYPAGAVPAFLSNTTLETYLQNYNSLTLGFGSCVACHSGANLTTNQAVLTNLSFLPGLVNPVLTRRAPLPPDAKK